jgi:hypothetical protein
VNRALLWLWAVQRRNAILRYLRRFTRPRELPRAILPLAAIALVVFAMRQGSPEQSPLAASTFLTAALAAYLLLDVFRGFSDRGIAFEPAEVNFLFPGPFPRTSLVVYHLLTTYSRSLISLLFFFVFFGVKTSSPALALVGTALTLAVGEHLRVVAALLSVNLAEKTVARLAGPVRALALIVALVMIFLLVPTLASRSGIGGGVARALESGWARVAFYPAVAAGELSSAASLGDAVAPTLGLLACAVATLAALLALQVHFLEASLVTSDKRAAVLERARRGRRVGVPEPGRRVRSGRAPSAAVFRGAGAVLWRNLVVARRSGRALVFSGVFSMLFILPAFLGVGRDAVPAMAFGALMPLFLSSAVAFDFRGEADQMARLKTLPVGGWRLALAEVAGSSVVTLAFQVVLLVALVAFADLPMRYAPLALAAYVPVTVGLLAAANLAHLLAPKASFMTFLLQMGFLVANGFLHAGAAVAMHEAGFDGDGTMPARLMVHFALQVAATAGTLWLVGRAFDRFDVGTPAA